jgi:2-polyprenyl-3-methyl-5-hydroxy-6-metoxy-1,4-benzoquinol methylase
MELVHDNCLICSSLSIKPLKGYSEVGLVKCTSCSFVFMKKIPSEEELANHYSSYSYRQEGYLSPITIKVYNRILDSFERYRKTNRILDVGCGRGYFLDVAKQRGWEVFGSEFSETAVKLCSGKGINMLHGKIHEHSFRDNFFDIITSFEVIEHINNPKEDLNAIYGMLRKGGGFYCTTPNFNSIMRFYLKDKFNVISYPEHLAYYTTKTLEKVVCETGFKKHRIISTGISVTRIKNSLGKATEKNFSKESTDEILREKIENNLALGIAKKLMNYLFTITGTGLSLKGFFIK